LESVPLACRENCPDSIADLYQTRAGKLVTVLKDAVSYEAFDYCSYDTPEELVASDIFKTNPYRGDLETAIGEALGHKWTTWID
jgi:hypothetical protein